MRTMFTILLGIVFCQIGGAADVAAKDVAHSTISDFYGSYVGTSDRDIVKGVAARDASVVIKPSGKSGFNISWKTVIRRTNRKPKVTAYSIGFVPRANRDRLYASAMKKNLFGHLKPLDPLSGDPYVWASIRGKTLTVRALFILDDGGYEIQIYKRTLVTGGMDLRFERVRNGKTMKLITATLKKKN